MKTPYTVSGGQNGQDEREAVGTFANSGLKRKRMKRRQRQSISLHPSTYLAKMTTIKKKGNSMAPGVARSHPISPVSTHVYSVPARGSYTHVNSLLDYLGLISRTTATASFASVQGCSVDGNRATNLSYEACCAEPRNSGNFLREYVRRRGVLVAVTPAFRGSWISRVCITGADSNANHERRSIIKQRTAMRGRLRRTT